MNLFYIQKSTSLAISDTIYADIRHGDRLLKQIFSTADITYEQRENTLR